MLSCGAVWGVDDRCGYRETVKQVISPSREWPFKATWYYLDVSLPELTFKQYHFTLENVNFSSGIDAYAMSRTVFCLAFLKPQDVDFIKLNIH